MANQAQHIPRPSRASSSVINKQLGDEPISYLPPTVKTNDVASVTELVGLIGLNANPQWLGMVGNATSEANRSSHYETVGI